MEVRTQTNIWETDGTGKLFIGCEHKLMPEVEVLEAHLIALADNLVDEFRDRRKLLYDHLVKAQAPNEKRNGPKLYSSVSLFSRHKRGSLQVYWQNVNRNTRVGREAYQYIRQQASGGYSIQQLQRSAGYAADLVAEFEVRAAEIRRHWKGLMTTKRSVQDQLKRLPPHAAMAAAKRDGHAGLVPRSPGHLD